MKTMHAALDGLDEILISRGASSSSMVLRPTATVAPESEADGYLFVSIESAGG
jgi:hypothetical protein